MRADEQFEGVDITFTGEDVIDRVSIYIYKIIPLIKSFTRMISLSFSNKVVIVLLQNNASVNEPSSWAHNNVFLILL